MGEVALGRKPTLEEVVDYYTRHDFLSFLLHTLQVHRVVTVIPRQLHWEPDWERDEVQAADEEQLRQVILERIATQYPHTAPGGRPDYYPSFHISVWRRDRGEGHARGEGRAHDCVFEADLPTWRDAFRDVGSILALMDRYQIPYRHKFSGHRSLHVVIPAEVVPRRYRGRGTIVMARLLVGWGSSQAHSLPQITRMPYSLNEDTGLVCLPVARGALAAFRPWQASLHLVEVNAEAWHEDLSTYDEGGMASLLETLDSWGDRPHLVLHLVPARAKIVAGYRARLDRLGERARAIAGSQPLPEAWLLERLACGDEDTRWLACEAYLLRGTGLSGAGLYRLLEEQEPYARAAAIDVTLRFADDILEHLVRAIAGPADGSLARANAAYLLTQSDELREKVLEAIAAQAGAPHEALILAACLTGAIAGDWHKAFAIVGPIEEDPVAAAKAHTQLAALEIMRQMGGWSRREGAVLSQQLAALGPEVTDLLLAAAGTPHRRLRRDVIGALGILADPRATELLIRALGDDYTKVRRKAVQGLIAIGETTVPALIEAAASDQASVRRYAVHCLGAIGDPRGRPAALGALDDGDDRVRRQATRALLKLATLDDVPRLQQSLREAGWENALEAGAVLDGLGEAGQSAMRRMAFEEHNLPAAYYIAREGDDRGKEILAHRLPEGETVEETAAELLRELKDERCVPYFRRVLPTIVDWRGAFLALEMGRIGGAEAIAVAVEALSSQSRHARRGAARGLAEAKDPSTVAPLLRALEDEDSKVRSLAADALVEIGRAAIEPLRRALAEASDRGGRARPHLQRVLRRLGADAKVA
jgi:HEAT repeat protein